MTTNPTTFQVIRSKPFDGELPKLPPSIYSISRAVTTVLNIPIEDIRSKNRKGEIAYARHLVMYLTKQETQMSLSKIGNYLNKDHATVIHGSRRISDTLYTEAKRSNRPTTQHVKLIKQIIG